MNGWRRSSWALVAVALWGTAAAAAPPMLMGIYDVGNLGLLEFKSEDGRVVGRYRVDGDCDFPRDKQVVSGVFEGGVFVGSVALCQSGTAACKEKSFPFLGIWHDDRLTADVRVDADCQSRGLSGKRLVIAPATTAQKKRAVDQVDAVDVARGTPKKASDAELKALIVEGQRRLSNEDFEAARDAFARALSVSAEPGNWQLRVGLGAALSGLKQYNNAVTELRKAANDAERAGEDSGLAAQDLHYNLASIYTQMSKYSDAISELRQAVDLGYTDFEKMQSEPDFAAIRTEPDFRRLVERAKKAHRR